jgi:hypothetical protein
VCPAQFEDTSLDFGGRCAAGYQFFDVIQLPVQVREIHPINQQVHLSSGTLLIRTALRTRHAVRLGHHELICVPEFSLLHQLDDLVELFLR